MIIGIAGLGAIGGAFDRMLKNTTGHEHHILGWDPPLGIRDDISKAEAIFICVPVPTVGSKQDLSIVEDILKTSCNETQRIYVRSSVLPGTCDALAKKFKLRVYAMPEFLTERKADADALRQGIVCGCGRFEHTDQYDFLNRVFLGKKNLYLMLNSEAELSKYMHNGNGTVKVSFNSKIYQLCQKMGINYDRVRLGCMMSGYVSHEHTAQPGPDTRLGYGGKCFPKDLDALIGKLDEVGIQCGSLKEMQSENVAIRGVDQYVKAR